MHRMIQEFRTLADRKARASFIEREEFFAYLEYVGLKSLCSLSPDTIQFTEKEAEFLNNLGAKFAIRMLGGDLHTLEDLLETLGDSGERSGRE